MTREVATENRSMVRWGGWEMVVVVVIKGHVQRVWGPAGLCGVWGGAVRGQGGRTVLG